MSSGSPLIGDARHRAAAFVAGSRNTASSLHAQTPQTDAFADVFRFIANASPPAASIPSRSSEPRADTADREDDDSRNPEKPVRSESDTLHPLRQVPDNTSSDRGVAVLTLPVQGPEQKPALDPDAVDLAAGVGDEEEPQEAVSGGMDVVAASQYQAIVSAGSPEGSSPEGQPKLPEAKPDVEQALDDKAHRNEPQSTKPAVGANADAVELAATSTRKVNDQPRVGEVVPVERAPTEGIPVVKQDATVQPSDEALPEPTRPAPSPSASASDASETVETVADVLAQEDAEEEGKPIFAGPDEEQSDSRRRHDDEPRFASRTNDPLRSPGDPMAAGLRGPQVELVSAESGIESMSGNQAMLDLNATVEATQRNAGSLPQPVVSAVAAYGAAASDAASTKSSSPSTPQIGTVSTQPAATDQARPPSPGESSGPGVADRIRLVQRVANAFQRLGVAGGEVRIRLHPAELGGVRLDLQIQGKRLNARVTTETEAARGVLREHLSDLRQRLSEQGIQVERIDVELETESERHRESAHRDDAAGRFGQPSRRDGRTPVLQTDRDQRRSPAGGEAGREPGLRSVADAAAQPGVDLVF